MGRWDDITSFLQWALPKLDKRWSGFRKPLSQVTGRITDRMAALELSGLEAYDEPSETTIVDDRCATRCTPVQRM